MIEWRFSDCIEIHGIRRLETKNYSPQKANPLSSSELIGGSICSYYFLLGSYLRLSLALLSVD